ncbi:MAG: hypothetical protein ACYC5O_23730 [Anaerolineae bacterium]
MEYIEGSEALVGYKAKVWKREPFIIVGYTLIVPPHNDEMVGPFWFEVMADGRLDALKAASSVPTWVLGLGSWDPECEKGGMRYTISIEETAHTDFGALEKEQPLFRMTIGASDWLCFEMTEEKYFERFWQQDNPYTMMKPLGYRFNAKGVNVGLHFDAYPPGFATLTNSAMEFWITVVKE